MTVKQFAVRFKPEGTSEVVQAAKTTESALVHTADATAEANRRAEESAARLAKKYAVLAEAARSAAQAEAAQGRFNAALGVGGGSGVSARDSAAVFMADDGQAERAARLKAILDPLGAAQDRYNDELREFNQLAAAGRISQTELSQAQALAKTRLDETTVAIQRQERGLSRLAMASRLNLARQGADVAVTAAMGMNPAMIAIQQGPQILDAWATSAIKLSPAMIGLGLAFGAAAGGAVAVIGGMAKGEASALAYERAVTGVGRTAGLTADELRDLTRQAAEQGEVSIDSAQKQAAAYLASGRISRTVLLDLISVGKDYAAMMGIDAEQATKDLAAAMLAPEKAGRDLTRQMGLLDQKTLNHIDSLVKAGDLYGAQRVLMDGISQAAAGHAEKVGIITSAWDAVGNSISNAITKLGEFLYLDEGERLQQIIDRRASIERGQRENGRPLDARTQGIYDTLGRDGQAILNARERRAAQAREAASNQTAQLDRDRREAAARAGRGAARSAEAEARRREREAEEAAREALQRRRREEDVRAAKDLEIAKGMRDSDEIRRLEDVNAVRGRARDLEDDGVKAEEARAQAMREQLPLIEARRVAAQRDAADLRRSAMAEVARLEGDNAVVDAAERHADLLERIQSYTEKNVGFYEAWARAAQDLRDIDGARAEARAREVETEEKARQLRLAQMSGDWRSATALDRDLRIAARARGIEAADKLDFGQGVARATKEVEDETRAALIGARLGWAQGLALDIRQSGIKGALASQLDRAGDKLIVNIVEGLMRIKWGNLLDRGGGGSGVAGWISKGLNFLIGQNADGTDNWRGGWTMVGERGPELANLPRGTEIMSHGESLAALRRPRVSAPRAAPPMVFDMRGAVVTADLLAEVNQKVADGAATVRGEVPGLAIEAITEMHGRSHGQWL